MNGEATYDKHAPTYMFVLPWDLHYVGGVNEVVRNLVDGIRRDKRYRPLVLSSSWNAVKPVYETEEGRQLVRLRLHGPHSEKHLFRNMAGYALYAPLQAFRILRVLRSNNVRVINVHYVTGASFIFCILKKLRLFKGRLLFSVHGTDARSIARKSALTRWLWYRMLKSCDYVVANSDGLRRELEASLNARLDNTAVVHNGTDAVKNLAAADSHEPAAADFPQPYILSIGTFIKDKGHDLLIKAFNQIDAPGAADFHLVLIGRDDDFRQDCIELARNLGIEQRVRFLVNLPHAVCMASVRRAEFFVLPSRFETFSLVLLEAAGFGKAVIATDVCGVRELVIDDSLGIVIPRDDTDAMAEAMQTLIRDKARRDDLGKNLQTFVTQQFTWSRAVQEYLDLAAGSRSE